MQGRILVIGQYPPPVHGSNVMTERFVAALEKNAFEVLIVQKRFSRSLDEVGTVTLSKILRIPDLYRRVHAAIRQFRPDCCVYFITVGLGSLLVDCLVLSLLRKRQIPYILYFHGQGYIAYTLRRYMAVRGIIRRAFREALGGLILGERLKRDIEPFISESRLLVLPNGIPPIDVRESDGGDGHDTAVWVVFLSNLIPTKGPARFLKMAKLVSEQEPDVHFVMAGRPASEEYLSELRNIVTGEGLGRCVELRDAIYGPDKDRLLRRMDIFVLPTEKDTSPIVIFEAMQRGVPVVSSPVGAIPEVVKDAINGYIVNPDDIHATAERVLRLVRDPVLRKKMGNMSRALFEENYSLAAYHRNTKRVIDYFLKLGRRDQGGVAHHTR
jgi:glycosyltransferase involved in cell wall biosynthesis